MMCITNDVPRRPLSTSVNMNGKRRIGALSSMQGGLFAEASASSKSSSSSSSYLSRLLQSRTSSGTLAGRINTTPSAATGTSSTQPTYDNGNGSVISTWDRRSKPSASLLGSSLRDGRMTACLEQRYGENRPAAAAAAAAGQTRRMMQKRPRKPTDAYQYFFREQCREISKLESSRRAADGDDDACGMTCSGSNKRRKSPTGQAIHLGVDIGKIIAKKWRELSSDRRKRYEDMADEDAERYRKEVEEYYMQPDAAAAGMPRATTGRLAAIMAASSSATRAAASNHLLMGNNGNGNSTSVALTAVNKALSTTASASTSTSTSTSLATTNKTSLQSLLHERRKQLLDDLSSLNQITSSRLAAGRPALSGPVDPAVRQRLYHLSVGPGSGSSSGNAAIGPSPWGKAVRLSNTAASSYLTATTAAGKTQSPAIRSTSTLSLKTSSSPPVVSDGPTIEILD